MASVKELRTRIASIAKTQKITRAMKMISAARLARAAREIEATRPYAAKLREVLGSVAGGVEADVHPLLTPRERVHRLEIVLFTSDKGLCGGYNASLVKCARELIETRQDAVDSITLVPVGRKGGDGFKRDARVAIERQWTGLARVNLQHAREIGDYLMRRYAEGAVDEVVLVYSVFQSALSQTPGHEALLPVCPTAAAEEGVAYEIEPSAEELLGLLVPRTVEFSIFRALLENQAGEHGARMNAMDSATSNTEELIETLTLKMNKARQAAITAELVEIVSGAEAL